MKRFYEGLVVDVNNPESAAAKNGKIPYTNVANQYTDAQKFSADCAELTIVNQGTTTLFLNGIAFAPGTGIAFACNDNEADVTLYSIRFSGAGNNLCTIWRKVYV